MIKCMDGSHRGRSQDYNFFSHFGSDFATNLQKKIFFLTFRFQNCSEGTGAHICISLLRGQVLGSRVGGCQELEVM